MTERELLKILEMAKKEYTPIVKWKARSDITEDEIRMLNEEAYRSRGLNQMENIKYV